MTSKWILSLLIGVCGAVGIALIVMYNQSLDEIDDLKAYVASHRQYETYLKHVRHEVDHLLVTTDLIFGSNETYLAHGATEQLAILRDGLKEFDGTDLAPHMQASLSRIRESLDTIEDLIISRTEGMHNHTSNITSEELKRYDTASQLLIQSQVAFSSQMAIEVANKASELSFAHQRSRYVFWISIAILPLLSGLLWKWVRQIPLETKHHLTFSRYSPIIIVAVVGITITVIAFIASRQAENKSIKDQFNHIANNHISALERVLDQHLQVLRSISAFWDASNIVDRNEFRLFTRPLLAKYKGIQALEWVPRVDSVHRDKYEQEIKSSDLLQGFQFTERDTAGNLVRAADRSEYYPVWYLEPFESNKTAFGYDLGSDTIRREALENARDTGRPVASGQITLIQESGQQNGILVSLPKYRAGESSSTIKQRRVNLDGFVLGIFRVGDLIDHARALLDTSNIDILIEDLSAPDDEMLLHRNISLANNDSNPSSSGVTGSSFSKLTHYATISFGGRKWRVVCIGDKSTFVLKAFSQSWGILGGGVVFTGLLSAYLMLLLGRTEQVRQLVEQRTTELKAAKEAAEYADHAKSEFLASMSHEIRTPMTATIGYADLICRPNMDQETTRNLAKRIHRNANHLISLLNDVLDLSKIEAGQLQVDICPVSIIDIVSEVESIMRPLASEKLLGFSVVWQSRLPKVFYGDTLRIRQILINLVSNAIKFTEKGQIDVTIGTRQADADGKCEFVISVTDTGIGIPPDKLELIFSPFTQINDQANRLAGTGLGLDISKKIATMLGMQIKVTSVLNQGSTFRLVKVLNDEEQRQWITQEDIRQEQQCIEANDPAPKSIDGARILVVDDNPDNREIVRLLLEDAGASVAMSTNGQEGLVAATTSSQEGTPYDAIIMDMQMPVMDGYTATRRIREEGLKQPIIALTANAMAGDDEQCYSAGCTGYVPKPIVPKNLLGVLASCLGQSTNTTMDTIDMKKDEPALTGNPRFIQLVKKYTENLDSIAATLREAYESGDDVQLETIAHRLKGSAANYGYPEISEVAAECENAIKESLDRNKLSQHVERLISIIHQAIDQGTDGKNTE